MTTAELTQEQSATDLRKRVKEAVDHLSDARVRSVADFVGFIHQLECEEATRELESIPGFREAMRRGLQQIAEGKTTPLDEIRKDV